MNTNVFDFANEALNAMCSGGEVDFKNEIILNPSFNNNQKVMCVYSKLLTLENESYFKKIIFDLFDSDDKSNITFKIANLPQNQNSSAFNAVTLPNYPYILPGNSMFTIYLDTTFANNASTLEIALTLIHELIHAELLQRCIELGIITSMTYNQNYDGVFLFNNGTQVSNLNNNGLTIINYLIQLYRSYPNPDQWNHELISALNYNNIITQNLIQAYPLLNDVNYDFITNINTDNNNNFGNFTLQDAMFFLSWRGLEDTQIFINTIQNNINQLNKKNYIDNVSKTKFTTNCSN